MDFRADYAQVRPEEIPQLPYYERLRFYSQEKRDRMWNKALSAEQYDEMHRELADKWRI